MRGLIIILMLLSQFAVGQRLHLSNYPLLDEHVQLGTELIARVDEGLVYVSAGDRLYTFDGLNYSLVDLPNNSEQLITALFYESNGALWIGFSDGQLLSSVHDTFAFVDIRNRSSGFPITRIVKDEQQRIWFSSYGGGLYVKMSGESFFSQIEDIGNHDIYGLSVAADKIWISSDDGIYSCTLVDGHVSIHNVVVEDGLIDAIVKDLAMIDKRLMLATQENGIVSFHAETRKFTTLTPNWKYGDIHRLKIFDSRECWILTERHGVFSLNLKTLKLDKLRDKNGSDVDQIEDLILTNDGNIWLCSSATSMSRGLRFFEFYDVADIEIQMIHPSNTQVVFLGSNKGLYRFDLISETSQIIPATEGFNIISMEQIEDCLLLGTFDDGLVVLQLSDMKIRQMTEKDGLPNNSIITLEYNKNKLWLSSLAGVCNMKVDWENGQLTFTDIQKIDLLTNDYVYDILIIDSSFYFATDGHGVAKLNQGKLTYYNQDASHRDQIFCLAKGHYNRVWAIENTHGICLVDNEKYVLDARLFTTGPDALAMASDGKDHMMVMRRNGAEIIDEKTRSIKRFGIENGFDAFQPALNGITEINNSQLFVSSNDKVVKVIPQANYGGAPKLLLNYVKAGNRKLEKDKRHKLGVDEHTLHFNMTALYYANPESVSFRYKLNGHDETWKETRDQNIIYSKLAPGTYTFLAEANSSMVSNLNTEILQFEFEIRTPLWQRWWFIILFCLLSLWLIYALMKHRERMITQEKVVQNAVIERQYEVLKNQLNPHFLFNAFNNLIGYIEEDPKTAVTVVERLADFYRKILEVKENKLVTIEQELNLLSDYVYLLNKRFDGSLLVSVDIKDRQSLIPPMTLQILVENAVKHNVLSHRNPLEVSIFEKDDQSIEIVNAKRLKRTSAVSTGIGLQNIDKRYRLLGDYNIEVADKHGKFRVVIPKIRTK